MRNGPIDGYVLSYRRTARGGKRVNENSRDIVVAGRDIIRVDGLAMLSTYEVNITAYNLLMGKRLVSRAKQIIISTVNKS